MKFSFTFEAKVPALGLKLFKPFMSSKKTPSVRRSSSPPQVVAAASASSPYSSRNSSTESIAGTDYADDREDTPEPHFEVNAAVPPTQPVEPIDNTLRPIHTSTATINLKAVGGTPLSKSTPGPHSGNRTKPEGKRKADEVSEDDIGSSSTTPPKRRKISFEPESEVKESAGGSSSALVKHEAVDSKISQPLDRKGKRKADDSIDSSPSKRPKLDSEDIDDKTKVICKPDPDAPNPKPRRQVPKAPRFRTVVKSRSPSPSFAPLDLQDDIKFYNISWDASYAIIHTGKDPRQTERFPRLPTLIQFQLNDGRRIFADRRFGGRSHELEHHVAYWDTVREARRKAAANWP